jgi:hypothetical protein
MKTGYIYAFQNRAFGAHVVKIGLTTRAPDVRANEIYTGATGVPVKFEIAAAYSVGDCVAAEKKIHKRLKAFRMNKRREFFRVSPSVASAIILETCQHINNELSLPQPEIFLFEKSSGQISGMKDSVCEINSEEEFESKWVSLLSLGESPSGTSKLSEEQSDRVKIIGMMLERIFPQSSEDWLDGFTRDSDPEREIRIWECITKSIMSVEEVGFATDEIKNEAFSLLVMRSGSHTKDVLERISLKYFDKKSAKHLLDSYELRPMPIRVSK